MKKRGNHESKTAKSRQQNETNADDKKNEKKDEKNEIILNDDSDNQGFSEWLRSNDGLEMMRLFVIANSMLIFITMGLPKMQEVITVLKEYFNSERIIMLGLVFRGVFLIGILTWYSTSVWKMIDGYFRDQFRSYLEEEYRKNPRMKSDVQGNPVDKTDPVVTTPRPDPTVEPQREMLETDETESVEAAENNTIKLNEEEQVTDGTSENKDIRGSDKNAFQGASVESGLESRKSSNNEQDSRQPISHNDRDLEREENDRHRSVSQASRKKRIKYNSRSTLFKDASREQQSKSGNVKTITLTDNDFKSVIGNEVSNDDFWEFEEDADEKEPVEGILVSQLPFKPRADIGDLERVTEDEYCPLTLDDEAACDETFKWP